MDYTNRNWLLRVVQSGRDGKMFHEFWRELGALVADATWGASHQNNINVAALLQRLDPSKPCPYQVWGGEEPSPGTASCLEHVPMHQPHCSVCVCVHACACVRKRMAGHGGACA